MKRSILLMAVIAVGTSGLAQFQSGDANKDGKVTLEEYQAFQKTVSDAKGTPYDEAAIAKKFDSMDKNKDGVWTPDEVPPPAPKAK